jgi:hypothetical protein
MFFGLMMVDAALAAWAVGLMQQPGSPRWVRFVLYLLGITFAISVGVVTVLTDRADNDTARAFGLIAPAGAVVAAIALLIATISSRRSKA